MPDCGAWVKEQGTSKRSQVETGPLETILLFSEVIKCKNKNKGLEICLRLRIYSLYPELAVSKVLHSFQGQLPSVLDGLFMKILSEHVWKWEQEHVCTPVVSPMTLKQILLVQSGRKQMKTSFLPRFECEVKDVAARESQHGKNVRVKFNYLKWSTLKKEQVCFKLSPFSTHKTLVFYLAGRNWSSAAVSPGLGPWQTKEAINTWCL